MLQHEINHFLDPLSRLHWNEVLKKDERVYNKFPKDYAIKHQIKLSHDRHQALAKTLQFSLGRVVNGGWEGVHVPPAVKLLKKYFAFFKDPKNQLAIMYVKGLKPRFLESISQWTQIDMELYQNLSHSKVEALRDEALETLNIISAIPFLRNVPVRHHQNAFAA